MFTKKERTGKFRSIIKIGRATKREYKNEDDLLNAVDRDVIGLQVGVELSYLTVPEQEMVEEVHESTGKYPSLEQAKK